jgi:acyl-CoA thioester hydrolase
MKHECRLTVRSYECDANGHVNNATYVNYLEVARVEFLGSIGVSYRELREHGFGLVVVRVAIDYKAETFMEDRLVVVTESVKKRFTGGTFHQAIYREGDGGRLLAADAEVEWVCVNDRRRPVRLPPLLDRPELSPEQAPAG